MHDHAALQVLTDRSLFASIIAFADGVPFFAVQVKRQLRCIEAQPVPEAPAVVDDNWLLLDHRKKSVGVAPEDVELWQNAVRSGDRRTLEALHMLASLVTPLGERVRALLIGIFDFALTLARDSRDMALLEWIVASEMFVSFDDFTRAAFYDVGESGGIEMVRWLHEHGFFISSSLADGAASSGDLDVLLFFYSLGPELATIDSDAIWHAASNGHLHVLEFLMQQREWDLSESISEAYEAAAGTGQLHVIQYLHESGIRCTEQNPIDEAATNGHLDTAMYLHMNRIGSCSKDALTGAVKNGHLDIVKFLCANGRTRCKDETFTSVVKSGRLDILQILCESRVGYAVECAMMAAIELGKVDFVKFLYVLAPTRCASEGVSHTANAAERGHLDIIKFFHECGDPSFFDWQAMHCAAGHGHFDIVKFLHENREEGCGSTTVSYAHESGHHDIVDYLCENRPANYAVSLCSRIPSEHYPDISRRRLGLADLAEKIAQSVAAAQAAGRKVYSAS